MGPLRRGPKEIEYPNLSTVTSKHWPWAKDTFEADLLGGHGSHAVV